MNSTDDTSIPPRRRGQRITIPKNGALFDLVAKHQRRRLPSELIAEAHGEAWTAALRVADARQSLDVLEGLAARDHAAGRSVSAIMADRIRSARAALHTAEAALAVARKNTKAVDVEVVEDED